MPVKDKFQICTISVPDILETCQFRPKKHELTCHFPSKKKLKLNRIIGQPTKKKMVVNSCFLGRNWHVSRMPGTKMIQI
ncbi:hypothetical protein Hanom_Chr04g00340171 [Helianthus anomalus]